MPHRKNADIAGHDGRLFLTTCENLGPSWLPMAGDYDGDGLADFAWYNASEMRLHILYGNGVRDDLAVPEVGSVQVRPAATPAAALYLNPL